MRRGNKFIAGGALFLTAFATGCSDEAIEANPGDICAVVAEGGNQLSPSSYPEGPPLM